MNVLELCLSPDLGGLELYVYRASMKLAETDNVYAALSEKGKLAERFSDKNVPLYFFKKPFTVSPVNNGGSTASNVYCLEFSAFIERKLFYQMIDINC